MSTRSERHVRHGRQGSVYVFVLGAAMLITTAGIIATTFQSSRLARQRSLNNTVNVDAEHAAAVEYGLELFRGDPSGNVWRPYRKVVTNAPAMLGTAGAAHVITLTDPRDDDLETVNLADPVRLTVTSIVGGAKRASQVDFAFDVTPISALSNAVIYEQKIGGGTLSVTGTVATSSARPTPDAAFHASAQIGVTPAAFLTATEAVNNSVTMTVPAPSADLFSYYQSIGTVITLSGERTFEHALFSPTSNPANTGLNAKGVYVIRANGHRVNIGNARVYGTLVIVNPGTSSAIGPKVTMSPASSDMPTLLIQGSMKVLLGDDDLTESDAERNLNPTGAPYLGTTDGDSSDSYPSRIRGLVYVSNSLVIDENSAFEGVLWVGGKLSITGARTASVRWMPLTDPIPGFMTATSMYVQDQTSLRLAP